MFTRHAIRTAFTSARVRGASFSRHASVSESFEVSYK